MNSNNGSLSTAVLRIISTVTGLDEISKLLDKKPTRSHSIGEPYSRRNPNSRLREENIWLLESGLDRNLSLEAHIESLLSFIRKKKTFLRQLQDECEIDIMCSFSSTSGQGGFALNHNLLNKLTEIPLNLIVNLYPPEGEEVSIMDKNYK